jgi:hypothetical protein
MSDITKYHLDEWADSDFKSHIPAVRQAIANLIRERDEARAEAARLLKQTVNYVPLSRDESEARGYERGVREAARVGERYYYRGENPHSAILVLLEPSLSPEDKP